MRLASSWMVIASGIVTSRMSFSFGSLLSSLSAPALAAAERGVRALAHFVGAQRGDQGQAAARLLGRGLGGARRPLRRRGRAHGAAGAAADHARAFVFLGFELGTARRALAAAAVSPSPKRFLATSSALRLVSSSCLRRSSSSRLRASAASRSARLDGLALRADLGLFLGDLALFGLAQAGVAERVGARGCAPPRSACAARRRMASAPARPERERRAGGGGLGGGAGVPRAWRPAPRRRGRRRGFGLASAPAVRRFLTSTTTCLLRPWLKLWRTTPVSVRGLSDSVVGADAQRLAVRGLRLSHSVLESCQFRCAAGPPSARLAGPKALQARKARQKRVACRPGKQGCMYHI